MGKRMSVDEIAARDKRRSALHEAAHLIVAAAFGCEGVALLIPNPDGGRYDKHWVGKFRGRIDDLDPAAQAAVGVAGFIAEEYWEDEPDVEAEVVIDQWRLDDEAGPSAADMEVIPPGWNGRLTAVRDAVRILRERRSSLESAVAILVARGFVAASELQAG